MATQLKSRRRLDLAKTPRKKAAGSVWPALARVCAALTLSGAVAVAAWFGYQHATQHDYFLLQNVTTSGAVRATNEELVRLGKLNQPINLLAVDIQSLERLLKQHPWVRRASVERHWPSTLHIEIEEHQAVAVLAAKELYLVNREGLPFKRAVGAEALHLPLVTGIERPHFQGSAERLEVVGNVKRAVDAAQSYSAHSESAEHPLSEIHVNPIGLTLVMQDGQEVRVVDGDFEAQWRLLQRVRRELTARKWTAEVIRLDNRARRDWVTLQLKPLGDGELASNP
jgi:cell division septal protein FtsQ